MRVRGAPLPKIHALDRPPGRRVRRTFYPPEGATALFHMSVLRVTC